MNIAGARRTASRIAVTLRGSRRGSAMRGLAADLATALRARPRPPADIRELCAALCEAMSARRRGRPVELRFERFPDELEVTGLWVEFQDFDLVIVEERAEAVQQLVILGHELWHMHAAHPHHHVAGTAAADALSGRSGWQDVALHDGALQEVALHDVALQDVALHDVTLQDVALTVAARDGSRERDEAEADDFGHRLAATVRTLVLDAGACAPLDPVQRSMGYRGRGGAAR